MRRHPSPQPPPLCHPSLHRYISLLRSPLERRTRQLRNLRRNLGPRDEGTVTPTRRPNSLSPRVGRLAGVAAPHEQVQQGGEYKAVLDKICVDERGGYDVDSVAGAVAHRGEDGDGVRRWWWRDVMTLMWEWWSVRWGLVIKMYLLLGYSDILSLIFRKD